MAITRGYAEPRSQKLNSLYTARERARLTHLDNELKIASEDRVQAICREQSRISEANHPGKRNRESASTPQFDRSLILYGGCRTEDARLCGEP
jgi:hypothetical protein